MNETAEMTQEPHVLAVGQVADVIGMMSQFLSKLSDLEPIKAEAMGLVEWLSLRQIDQSEHLRPGQLATTLGVSRQRVAQIAKSLKSDGLIDTGKLEGGKGLTLTTTPAGKAKAARLDAIMTTLMTEKLQGKARAFETVAKRLPQLLRAIKPERAVAA